MDVTITQIEYALAVERCASFSRAARQCNISQPTLSMQIAKLESIVGARLFDRDAHPIVATPLGRRFLEVARRVRNELSQLQQLIDAQNKSHGVRVRVGIIPTVAPSVVYLLADAFTTQFPDASLAIHEQTTAELLRGLRDGNLDAAIVSIPLAEPDIVEHALYDEPFLVCLPADHPLAAQAGVTVDAVAEEELLLLREGHCMRNQALELCRIAQSPRPFLSARVTFESGSFQSLLPLVRRGLGVTLVPALAIAALNAEAREDGTGLAFREFRPPVPVRRVGIVSLRDGRETISVETIGTLILARIVERLATFHSWSLQSAVLRPFPEKTS